MTKLEINDSIIQALRLEFDSQNVHVERQIEIAKTAKALRKTDEFKEMVDDLRTENLINSAQADEILKR